MTKRQRKALQRVGMVVWPEVIDWKGHRWHVRVAILEADGDREAYWLASVAWARPSTEAPCALSFWTKKVTRLGEALCLRLLRDAGEGKTRLVPGPREIQMVRKLTADELAWARQAKAVREEREREAREAAEAAKKAAQEKAEDALDLDGDA